MAPHKGPITVLVVDDHADIRDLFRQVLSTDPDIRVVGTADSGRVGVETAIVRKPDIVVMDYVLPDMNGATAISQIKAKLPDTHIITVSGLSAPGAYQAAASAGSSAWLRKTSAARELKSVIHRVVEGESTVVADDLVPSVGELIVYYQSIHDLNTGAVVGWESLLRWGHPSGAVLSPEEFLGRAESAGRVSDFGRRVSEVAARQLSDWQVRHPSDPARWISVNLSAPDLRRPDLREWVGASIERARIHPSAFVLEVKEAALVDDPSEIARRLEQLKALGVKLAIDDFGGTFTSLRNVRPFPFDIVKVDRTSIAELPQSLDHMRRMEHLRQEAAEANLIAVAQGIERSEQAEALRGAGWELGQGFFLSKPQPAEVCEAALADSRSASE